MNADGVPVTVLSGSLGAGKTSLLNHLLEENDGRSIAVLVNDMGEINVDAELLSAGTDLTADGGIAELSNGCICCERQNDLETEVARLAAEREFEYLVVEASGISEPAPVASLFTTASRAVAAYDLDTLVTVVDADLFLETFGGDERLERRCAPGSEDRPLADLLVEQIEYANVLVLNKCDLLEEADLERAEELLATLTPDAEIVRTVHGRIDPDRILGTGLFDPAMAGASAGWQRALTRRGDDGATGDGHDHHEHEHGDGCSHDHDDCEHDHATPEDVYGVTSFPYRRRRPFHPDRLWTVLTDLPESVVRSKGLCWIAGRDDDALSFSQAGPTARLEVLGPWLASLPEIERDLYRSSRPDLEWHDDHGDRRTELVFIGQGIDEDALIDRLDACLLGDDERADSVDTSRYPTGEESLEFEPR